MTIASVVLWIVDPQGVVNRAEITPELDAAYDILKDDLVPDETIEKLLVGCLRSGENPEKFARHFVKLRKAVR